MPSRVPADQDTGFNEVNGGIRQVARWAVARSRGGLVRPLCFGRWRPYHRSTPKTVAEHRAIPTVRSAASETMSRRGNMVVAMSIPESSNSTLTMSPDATLSHGRFTQGPKTSRSLHNSTKKTVALGSSNPGSACTPVVINPNGAPGISTIAAAITTIPV